MLKFKSSKLLRIAPCLTTRKKKLFVSSTAAPSPPKANCARKLSKSKSGKRSADPRTGQPVIEPETAREFIDMLDALHEKTKGNLAPEDDSLLLDLLGKLKMTYLEVNQAVAAQAAAQAKAKSRP